MDVIKKELESDPLSPDNEDTYRGGGKSSSVEEVLLEFNVKQIKVEPSDVSYDYATDIKCEELDFSSFPVVKSEVEDNDILAVCPGNDKDKTQDIFERNNVAAVTSHSNEASCVCKTSRKKYKMVVRKVKKRKAANIVNYSNPYLNARESIHCNKEDEYECFGKYIASQLRKLPAISALQMQQTIQKMLIEERIHCLQSVTSPSSASASSASNYNVNPIQKHHELPFKHVCRKYH